MSRKGGKTSKLSFEVESFLLEAASNNKKWNQVKLKAQSIFGDQYVAQHNAKISQFMSDVKRNRSGKMSTAKLVLKDATNQDIQFNVVEEKKEEEEKMRDMVAEYEQKKKDKENVMAQVEEHEDDYKSEDEQIKMMQTVKSGHLIEAVVLRTEHQQEKSRATIADLSQQNVNLYHSLKKKSDECENLRAEVEYLKSSNSSLRQKVLMLGGSFADQSFNVSNVPHHYSKSLCESVSNFSLGSISETVVLPLPPSTSQK